MDRFKPQVRQKGIGLVGSIAVIALLMALSLAWASVSHFNECKIVEAEADGLSSCLSFLPDTGFNRIEVAPDFKSSIKLADLPTSIRRITDNDYFELEDGRAIHAYSRRQAWNADESLIDVGGMILLADRLDFLVDDLPVSSERVWSNTNPDIIYGFRFVDNVLNQFLSFNVRSFESKELIKLEESEACSIGRGEGSQSNDDQFIVFVCGDEDGTSELISFNIKEQRILGRLELKEYVDWASVSQSGEFVIVESSVEKDAPRRLMRLAIDLTGAELLSDERHHGDLGVDQNGDDVFVMLGDRYISYVRLKDGRKVQLPVSGYIRKAGHGHVSCRNISRPGWCYVSTYNNLIGAVKIAESNNLLGFGVPKPGVSRGQAVFEHWGYHESGSDNYAATPRASASPSGRRIIFSSNWRGSDQTNAFVLSLPQ